MEFKCASINGVSYGGQITLSKEEYAKYEKIPNVDFGDKKFFNTLHNSSHKEYPFVLNYLKVLALCHTVIVEEKNGKKEYNSASPDELALLNFAKFCGVVYQGLDENFNRVLKFPLDNKLKPEKYELLDVLAFNSTRKRMSVIVRDPKGKIHLYCKGADNFLFDRMKKPADKDGLMTVSE